MPTVLNEMPLHIAFEKNNSCLIRNKQVLLRLVDANADVLRCNNMNQNACYMAVKSGYVDVLARMLNKYAHDIPEDLQDSQLVHSVLDCHHETPTKIGLIHVLAINGINLDVYDSRGDTPLIRCIHKVDLPCVEALLYHGARPNHPSKLNKIPSTLSQNKLLTSTHPHAIVIVDRIKEYITGQKKPLSSVHKQSD